MASISLRQAGVYFAPRGELAAEMRKACEKGLYSAALRGKTLIVTRVMAGLARKPIDRGLYRAGWQVERIRGGGAAIFNTTPYAAAIEWGVPAANVVYSFKFQIALAEWVQRKIGGRGKKTSVEKMRSLGERVVVAKKRYNTALSNWKRRVKSASAHGKQPPAAPKIPPILAKNNRARVGADYFAAWHVAGAIMHALKKRGIFHRGEGLQILERFSRDYLPGLIKEECDKEMAKAVG